jgi:hypothetical protein
MVWIKNRDGGDPHVLFDTERNVNKSLTSNTADAEVTDYQRLTTFLDDGFRIGTDVEVNASNGDSYVSWTWRKAPKFFDVVTYTGDGTDGRDIAHNLECPAGFVLTKRTDASSDWVAYPLKSSSVGTYHYMKLNSTAAEAGQTGGYSSSTFRVNNVHGNNTSGGTYVAYLFAHNDGDGEFGPDGDQDIIKCGSYTGNGNDNGPEIDLGFEPQWVMVKNITDADGWYIFDNMRGMFVGGIDQGLRANSTDQEYGTGEPAISPTPTGFKVTTNQGWINNNNTTLIYMAIRRGPLAPPESATEVFDPIAANNSAGTFNTTGFPVDLQIFKPYSSTNDWFVNDRMRGVETLPTQTGTSGPYLSTNTTVAEIENYMTMGWTNEGFRTASGGYPNNNVVYYNWKRAPNFFDVVAYSGNSTAGRTVSHNLGVAPDLLIVKRRTGGGSSWTTYVSALGATKYLRVNNTNTAATSSLFWNNTSPTDSVFTLGTEADVNGSGEDYIAYLFASLPGISKVGSYTGTGNTLNVDCGFTSGARFVFIKAADDSGSWYMVDSARGIVAAEDPTLKLEEAAAEFDNKDWIDPLSSGFTITSTAGTSFNASGITYIFYAIA